MTRRVDPVAASEGSVEEPLNVDLLYRRYARYVAVVAFRILGRDDDLDDVVHDVFVAAARAAGQLRDPGAAKAWLATIAVHAAGRRLRARRLRRFLGLDSGADYEGVAAAGTSPEDRALIADVYAVLDEVAVSHRIAWLLRHVEGERLTRVASICRCSLATAKRRIALVQGKIEKVLRDEGHVDE